MKNTTEVQYEEHFYINELKKNPDSAGKILKDNIIKIAFLMSFFWFAWWLAEIKNHITEYIDNSQYKIWFNIEETKNNADEILTNISFNEKTTYRI